MRSDVSPMWPTDEDAGLAAGVGSREGYQWSWGTASAPDDLEAIREYTNRGQGGEVSPR